MNRSRPQLAQNRARVVCPVCEKNLSFNSIQRHLATVHPEIRPKAASDIRSKLRMTARGF